MNSRGILPQDNLFRAVYTLNGDDPAVVLRVVPRTPATATDAVNPGTGRTLDLQWYVADQWAEIDSWYEGNFMEKIAPGAAAKTIAENRANMRILLQHGKDPQLGTKPIAPIDEVGENKIGGYARGELFPGLDPLVIDGLRAGQYGASFRFRVMRDELVQEPEASDYNPKGIPERTIREMAVTEFGPVTWGAYSAATAGVRSLTDEIHFASLRDMPEKRLAALVNFWRARDGLERVDAEDLNCLGQMIVFATQYIDDQDEADESGNVDTMNQVLELLSSLVQVEAAEVEPVEPEDEGEYSAPDSEDESRRNEAPVEAPARRATPTTDSRYLSKRRKAKPSWRLS